MTKAKGRLTVVIVGALDQQTAHARGARAVGHPNRSSLLHRRTGADSADTTHGIILRALVIPILPIARQQFASRVAR